MAYMKNVHAGLKSLGDVGVFNIGGRGAPVSGVGGTGANVCGPGSLYTDGVSGLIYINRGTQLIPTWNVLAGGESVFNQASGIISSADITGTAVGQFGHASGFVMVPGQGLGNIIELISVIFVYDFSVAAYTGGGNVTVNLYGFVPLTGVASAANTVGAAADTTLTFWPSTVNPPFNQPGAGLALVAAAPFTNPGTAAGVVRFVANYRVYPTGL